MSRKLPPRLLPDDPELQHATSLLSHRVFNSYLGMYGYVSAVLDTGRVMIQYDGMPRGPEKVDARRLKSAGVPGLGSERKGVLGR